MDLIETKYGSGHSAEKVTTKYTWLLKDWNLLYDIHYFDEIESQQFLLNGTDGVTCQLFFVPKHEKHEKAFLQMELSHVPTFLSMIVTISSINQHLEKLLLVRKTFKEVTKTFDLWLNEHIPKTHKYLTNDSLILLVEFTIVKSVTVTSFPDDIEHNNFAGDFRKNLKALLDNEDFNDVTFVIENEKLYAHKVILAAKSDVFKAIFKSMVEKEDIEINITDIDADVFAAFLNYIYVGKVDGMETLVHKLIIVADKYEVYDLKRACENYMLACLDIKNVLRYLLIAHNQACSALRKKAVDFIKLNTHVLADGADYKQLAEHPALIHEIFGK